MYCLKIKLKRMFKINTGVACFVLSNIYTITYTQGVKSFRGKSPAAVTCGLLCLGSGNHSIIIHTVS